MPLWLTPRARLGVTASVIILILCVFLLTSGGSDRADTPTTHNPAADSQEENAPVTPHVRYIPRILPLPTLGEPLDGSSSSVTTDGRVERPGSGGDIAFEITGLQATEEPSGWLQGSPFTPEVFLTPALACGECDSGFGQLQDLAQPGAVATVPFGYAVSPGGIILGSRVPQGSTGPTEPTPIKPSGSGVPSSPGPPAGPSGNPPDAPPGDPEDPEDPGPEEPPIEVPETATILLAGIGALSLTVGCRLRGKQQS